VPANAPRTTYGAVHFGRQRKEVMRKLKLQMQVTVDGYVAGPEGQLDWRTFDMDPPEAGGLHGLPVRHRG